MQRMPPSFMGGLANPENYENKLGHPEEPQEGREMCMLQ